MKFNNSVITMMVNANQTYQNAGILVGYVNQAALTMINITLTLSSVTFAQLSQNTGLYGYLFNSTIDLE